MKKLFASFSSWDNEKIFGFPSGDNENSCMPFRAPFNLRDNKAFCENSLLFTFSQDICSNVSFPATKQICNFSCNLFLFWSGFNKISFFSLFCLLLLFVTIFHFFVAWWSFSLVKQFGFSLLSFPPQNLEPHPWLCNCLPPRIQKTVSIEKVDLSYK